MILHISTAQKIQIARKIGLQPDLTQAPSRNILGTNIPTVDLLLFRDSSYVSWPEETPIINSPKTSTLPYLSSDGVLDPDPEEARSPEGCFPVPLHLPHLGTGPGSQICKTRKERAYQNGNKEYQ